MFCFSVFYVFLVVMCDGGGIFPFCVSRLLFDFVEGVGVLFVFLSCV